MHVAHIEDEYHIAMTDDIVEDVKTVCNFSAAIENYGIEKGRAEGIEKGMAEGIEKGIAIGEARANAKLT